MFTVFISSVQKELAKERAALRDYIHNDPLLRHHVRVFLFEDLPATDRRADELYLAQVDRSDIYLGLFGNEYGGEDAQGLSPTEREFNQATAQGKHRLILVKGSDDSRRKSKMAALIRKASGQLVRRRFANMPDLTAQVYASLVQFLKDRGVVRHKPLDASACDDASLEDVSAEKVRWFLERAKAERNYAVPPSATPAAALRHLDLLDGQTPTYGGILLFGKVPQKFLPTSQVKCLHFHGTEVQKPIPSYQVFKGTAFDLVDQALDFVLSKLARRVEARPGSAQTARSYDVPEMAVREAIVNAVAHRDYTSKASVQVMVFADRVEVWNPGHLPAELTPDLLRREHPSIPANPLICDPLFLAHYVEQAGTGTLDMISLCRKAGVPEPDFEQRAGQFVVTIWRDWLTDEVLAGLGLNERQMKAAIYVKLHRRLTSGEYQRLTGASRATATRDLETLVAQKVLMREGQKRGVHYVLPLKRLKNDSIDSPGAGMGNASVMPHLTQGTGPQPAINPPNRTGPEVRTKGSKGSSAAAARRTKRTGNAPNVPSAKQARPRNRKGR